MAKMKIYAIVDLTLHLNKTNPPQLVVTAHGLTTSSDWSAPALVPLEKTLSPDGILDLEFVAQPPSEISLPVLTPICAVLVVEKDVERIVAVRVFSRTNDMIRFLGVAGPGPTTLAIGEEAGGVTTMATGEEDGGDLTTMATGEEEGLAAQRSRAGPTTMATGEEDGGGPTTMATGEEDGGRQGAVTTLALGEESGPVTTLVFGEEGPTTLAIGEEGPQMTTLALGEEGPHPTTLALGEEGPHPTTLAFGEEGGGTTPAFGEEGPTTFAVGEEKSPVGETSPTVDDPKPPFGENWLADLGLRNPFGRR